MRPEPMKKERMRRSCSSKFWLEEQLDLVFFSQVKDMTVVNKRVPVKMMTLAKRVKSTQS